MKYAHPPMNPTPKPHDHRLAPLAAALHALSIGCRVDYRGDRDCDGRGHEHGAAAILAELPDDWCGHSPEWVQMANGALDIAEGQAAEIARLRAEYEGLRPLAKSGASRAHLMESGVMVRHNGTLWECEAERCIAARELAWTPEERAAKSDALRAALEAER